MTAEALLLMMVDVPDEHEAAFNTWYNEVHIPELLTLPGFVSAERFRHVGPGIRYLALYRLTNAAAADSAAFQQWRAKSESTELWASRFTERHRLLYEKIFTAEAEN